MPGRTAWVWLVVAIALASGAAAQVVRVYAVQHRSAEELAPLVATALEGEGRVIADRRTNALVLSGSQRGVSSAIAMLAALDVRPHTVRLRYESRSARDLASAGANVRWRAGAGELRIGDVSERGASALAGELRILEGQSGRIATGTSQPLAVRRVARSGRGVAVEESTTSYVSAESGFEATPRVLRDGRVELALRPFSASLRPDGAIDHTSAETRLVLDPGATVALGGIARSDGSRHGSVASADEGDAAGEGLLLVTVDVE